MRGFVMKKKIIFVLLAVGCLFCSLAGCGTADYLEETGKKINRYQIDCAVDAGAKKLSAIETFTFRNDYDVTFTCLKFHLYPNAFREGAQIKPISAETEAKAYPNGKSFGSITVESVTVDGDQVPFVVGGVDFNVLEVPLKKELYTGETVTTEITFEVQLANVCHRLGYGKDTINCGNWYPVLCAVENNVFLTDPYYANGDPFCSEMANYEVNLRVDEKYVLAHTGDVTATEKRESDVIYKIKADCVRDFAFVLSDKFQTLTAETDGITVRYFYFADKEPERSLKTACDSLKTFGETIAKYPYRQLSVVETDFCYGGMEYPNLIYITSGLDADFYQQVIVHETAHQWWYGLVGNNEVKHAWMDEGLTEFSTAYFYFKNPSYNVSYPMMMLKCEKTYTTYVSISNAFDRKTDTSMQRAVWEYPSETEYVVMTYNKGMLMFDQLREVMGSSFEKGLKTYFEENKCKIAKPEDMIASFERAFGGNLEEWFAAWLNGSVVIGEK